MDKYKVLVAAPTYSGMDYCLDRFLKAIKQLDYSNYDILLVDNTTGEDYFSKLKELEGIIVLKDYNAENPKIKRIVSSRNMIIDYALKNKYDYIFMLDSDVIVPKDSLKLLLNCKKDIVSGIYFSLFNSSAKIKLLPVVFRDLEEKEINEIIKNNLISEELVKKYGLKRHLTPEEANSGELLEVKYPSGGCLLISKNVFKSIRYGLLDVPSAHNTTDDIFFFEEAKKYGFRLYTLTKVRCNHFFFKKYNEENKVLTHPAFI